MRIRKTSQRSWNKTILKVYIAFPGGGDGGGPGGSAGPRGRSLGPRRTHHPPPAVPRTPRLRPGSRWPEMRPGPRDRRAQKSLVFGGGECGELLAPPRSMAGPGLRAPRLALLSALSRL